MSYNPQNPNGQASMSGSAPVVIASEQFPAQGTDTNLNAVSGSMVQGLVNDTPNMYLVGQIQPLSLTPDGRLRTTTYPASTYMEMFITMNLTNPEDYHTMFEVTNFM